MFAEQPRGTEKSRATIQMRKREIPGEPVQPRSLSLSFSFSLSPSFPSLSIRNEIRTRSGRMVCWKNENESSIGEGSFGNCFERIFDSRYEITRSGKQDKSRDVECKRRMFVLSKFLFGVIQESM